jgi:hypothetical protein
LVSYASGAGFNFNNGALVVADNGAVTVPYAFSSGAIITTATEPATAASRGSFTFASGTTRIISYGANDSTAGATQFRQRSSLAGIDIVSGDISAAGAWTWASASAASGVVHIAYSNRADYGFGIFNLSTSTSSVSLRLGTGLSTGSMVVVDYKDGGNQTCGYVTMDTTANTVAYTNTSDERLKCNFTEFSALPTVLNCPVFEYERLSNPGVKERGYVAQRAFKHMPEAVAVGTDDVEERPWGVDYGRVTPYLHRAIQEQQVLITTQQSLIAALEARLTALETK